MPIWGKVKVMICAGVGRVGQDLLVAGHRRVEADLADRRAGRADAEALDDVAAREHQNAGRPARPPAATSPRRVRRRMERCVAFAMGAVLKRRPLGASSRRAARTFRGTMAETIAAARHRDRADEGGDEGRRQDPRRRAAPDHGGAEGPGDRGARRRQDRQPRRRARAADQDGEVPPGIGWRSTPRPAAPSSRRRRTPRSPSSTSSCPSRWTRRR